MEEKQIKCKILPADCSGIERRQKSTAQLSKNPFRREQGMVEIVFGVLLRKPEIEA